MHGLTAVSGWSAKRIAQSNRFLKDLIVLAGSSDSLFLGIYHRKIPPD